MTQQEALDILKLGHNVYLTGSAGSGKTHLLNQYIGYLKDHGVPVAVTASTGIAASHMGGITVHSWSGVGVRSALSPYDLEAMEEKRYLWDRFQKTKVLIIDEISMLDHHRLDLIDTVARFFKRSEAPFGGLQVVLSGDFFQLPPVSRKGEPQARFVYHSNAWRTLGLKVCYLTESHRHKDDRYLAMLNAIREKTLSPEIVSDLVTRINKTPSFASRPTKLYTHNADVDGINAEELDKTEGLVFTYKMSESGREPISALLKNTCLAPAELSLKNGAQVMFVKNNQEAGYVNGTLGVVTNCSNNYPTVKTVSGKIINAEPVEWKIEDDGRVLASVKQVPLRLAWAITVHKSQGMTLDAAEIDLSKSFEKGMGYVALSRLKSFEGLKLIGINDMALEVNEEISLFDKTLQQNSAVIQKAIQALDHKEKTELQQKYLSRITPDKKDRKPKKQKGDTELITKKYLDEKLSLKDISAARKLKDETIIAHIEQLLQKKLIAKKDIEYLKADVLKPARLEKIAAAFKKSKSFQLSPVKSLLPHDFTFSEIRFARLFIEE